MQSPFQTPFKPDFEELLSCLRRQKTPKRVHNMELFLDGEVQLAIGERYDLWRDIDPAGPYAHLERTIALHRFLGYDYVTCGIGNIDWPMHHVVAEDTAELKRAAGRHFVDQHVGPIASWEDFERYPWPDMDRADTRDLEWLQNNLPDDMGIIGGLWSHFAELLNWLFGYETLCYMLHDDRGLVGAVRDKITAVNRRMATLLLQFDRVQILWGSDDMGFRSGTLISPDDLREFALPGHKEAAAASHQAGRLYQLHSCGKLLDIMPDLIDDVKIDAKHSFEDGILSVIDHKKLYGDRLSLIGGVDVDLMCRADENRIRGRVRQILESCMPGGGYCLGTGNSVANYIPLDNYLAMLDEGRRWTGVV